MSDESDTLKNRELIIKVYISEYEKFREEIIHYLNIQAQIPIWTMGSAVVALPIIVTQTNKIPIEVYISLLYAIVIFFSSMTLVYVGTTYSAHHLASYLRSYIEPRVNELLADKNHKVLQWEIIAYKDRRRIQNLFLDLTGAIGINVILIFPGLISFLIINTSTYQPIISNMYFNSQYTWLHIIQIIAIFIYGLSICALLSLIFFARKNVVAKK